MKKTMISLACILASFVSVNAIAGGNAESGKALVAKYACSSCHGADLSSPIDPAYPKLAGQLPDYIAHALTAYQRGGDGANANGRVQAIMGPMAKQLSATDIQDIAAYVGGLPGTLVVVKEPKFIRHTASN